MYLESANTATAGSCFGS